MNDSLFPVVISLEQTPGAFYKVEIRIQNLFLVGCGETLSRAFEELAKALKAVAA